MVQTKEGKQIRASQKTNPINVYIFLMLIIFQGLSGLIGGIGLVVDPTGKILQISIGWLKNSPFNDYLVPGLILLTALGFFPFVVIYGLVKKINWGWYSALLLGMMLIIWIGVELLIIGYQAQPPLQLIYGSVGILILVLALLPSIQGFYKERKRL